ncbi:MAG: hypothetical protein LBG90_07775 [Spirochaetaceae bacterium]|jgi:hypothetical protein|nr:hypothetical protein [Spirochaetaceae bacterium]
MAEILEYIAFGCALSSMGFTVYAKKYSVQRLGGMFLLGLLQYAVFAKAHPFAGPFFQTLSVPGLPDLAPFLRGADLFFALLFSFLSFKDAWEKDKPPGYARFLRYIIDIHPDRVIIDDMPFAFKKEKGLYIFTFYHHPQYENNFFLQYAGARYDIHRRLNRCANSCAFSLTSAAFGEIVREFRLLPVKAGEYILLNHCEVQIRQTGFSYTVQVKKTDLPRLPAEALAKAQTEEDSTYRRYRKVRKPEVTAWLEQFRRIKNPDFS